MPWLPLIEAGIGAMSQQQQQDQQRKQASVNARYSPWTGQNPGGNQISPNGALQGAMQGGAAGMAQNQNNQNADVWKQWMLKNSQNGQPQAQNTMPGYYPQQPVEQQGGMGGGSSYFEQPFQNRPVSGWSQS